MAFYASTDWNRWTGLYSALRCLPATPLHSREPVLWSHSDRNPTSLHGLGKIPTNTYNNLRPFLTQCNAKVWKVVHKSFKNALKNRPKTVKNEWKIKQFSNRWANQSDATISSNQNASLRHDFQFSLITKFFNFIEEGCRNPACSRKRSSPTVTGLHTPRARAPRAVNHFIIIPKKTPKI